MTIAYYLVVVLHVIACLFLIGVVLLQQGKSQDLASAFGGGGTQTAFGPRGSANLLSKSTTVLAAVFMITSISLTLLRPRDRSILDQMAPGAAPSPVASAPAGDPLGLPPVPTTSAPAASGPASPGAPAAPAPAAPAAPATTAPAASPASR